MINPLAIYGIRSCFDLLNILLKYCSFIGSEVRYPDIKKNKGIWNE